MKFQGEMYVAKLSKVTKNQGYTLSPEHAISEKPQGWRQIYPQPL